MESVQIVLMSGQTLNLKVGEIIDVPGAKSEKIKSIDYNKCQTAIEIQLESGFTWGIPLQTIVNYTYS